MSELSVNAPGDLKFHSVEVDGNEITQFTTKAVVFQDIYTPFWSAQVFMMDSQNLIMNLPIKPGSKVTITTETDAPKPCTGRKKFTFYVYKIAERILDKQDVQGYILHCITEGFFENQKVRIQKAFKQTPPQELVNEFVGLMGGSLEESDPDPMNYDLTIPNWSPIAACEWVARFAKQPKGGADYVLYQSDDNKYKFKSIEKMLKDRSGLRLKQVDPNVRTTPGVVDEDSYINIESFQFVQQHDSVKNYNVGYYANTRITHDIISKTITTTPFKHGDDISEDSTKAPFDGKLFDGAELSNISYYPAHPGILDGTTPEDTQADWFGSRKTNMMKLEENRLVIQVPGFICGWKWLGKSCYIELPSHQDIDEGQELDRLFKGDYIITAMKHVVQFGRYLIIMELSKKRLNESY